MREMTKSMLSLSWALSLFGGSQLAGLFAGRDGCRSCDGAVDSLNAVTRTTEEQFGELLKATYRAGDAFQRGVVDATFGLATLRPPDAEAWMRTAIDFLQQSLELWNRSLGAFGGGRPEGPAGWGPVPPPR